MKEFTFKSTIFLLGGLVLVQALAHIADSVAPDGNTLFLQNDQRHVEQLLAQSQTIDAIAIGNSHTASINLKTLGYDGHKFVRADSDFFEVQYELEKLLPKMPAVKTVFVPVSYFSFHWDSAAAEDTEIRRIHMYTVMPSWQFRSGDIENFVKGKGHSIFPVRSIVREDNWEAIIKVILGSKKKIQAPVEIAEDDCRYMKVEDLTAHIESRASRAIRLVSVMGANHPGLETDLHKTVVEIIQYLKAQNIQVVFFTPPYFRAYTEFYQTHDPEPIALMKQRMRTLQQEYGIEYYDFSTEEEFVSNHRFFADGDHLNGCGAKLFSAKFKQVLATENEYQLGSRTSH
jgi:hypothetical protein